MPEPHLMSHLRGTVWGPAEFVGPPPRRLTVQAILGGCATAGAVIGSAVAGTWYGISWLADGEAGVACVALSVLHLCVVRAGRALVGITAVLGMCLAFQAPQAAVGLVLAERGRVESVVVTSVEGGPGAVSGRGRYLCSVVDEDGVPLNVRIWRGCERATRPGDAIAVVYDVKGRVPPRGVEAGSSLLDPLRDLGGWAAAFTVVYMVAVVRSCRLSMPAPGPRRVGRSGGWSSDGRAGGGRR
ncbi:hypothetical protein [Streptomyces canus]|uniref:hypothetical protein n=1 Tax=Streptomyces canus TaxID=58343 RepID=UPI00225C129C|nr:hypothetical protein [Streptomyces canus]MCX4854961.1 hypothetical protein [Streptomyces canus]